MNRIEKLLAKHCPAGVAFERLGDIARRNHGTPITAARMKELHTECAPVRIFAGGKTIADVPLGAIPEKDITTEPSIIVKSRGYIDFECYSKPFSHKNEFWSYTIHSERSSLKFVYYYLLTQRESLQSKARASSVKIPQLSISDTDKLEIPVPPLPVQEAIVEVLDSFTELEAELEAELAARRRQYEYYRDKLLTFKPANE